MKVSHDVRVDNLKSFLTEFVGWHHKVITGDEKGQAQIFLDRLFKAFGHDGVLDAGGQTEFRIRKSNDDGGGISFADLVWKPVVLIEMKRRGTDLQKHIRQAFDYWVRLVPNRPRYVVLCNFDEFRIYDFETQMDSPVDIVATADLPVRWGALAFLAQMPPVFGNDRVAVTRQAADALADCFKLLVRPGRLPAVDRSTAQRFILQMLVALFAEDIDLLPQYFVTNLLKECKSPTDTYDLLGGLFETMNNSASPAGGRYKGVRYFNGGLFAAPAKLELQDDELNQLRHAATFDWSKVQPDIFGTLFQHSLDDKERHAFGAHFTSPVDIMKIVGPTIVHPWNELIEEAKTLAQLRSLLDRLHHFRVLDPACGSGNFLYVAYRELKRLEARIFERMEAEFKSEASPTGQMRISFLSAQNFYGLDILPFAVELAKVTMMIARKLAIDELHITEQPLPLDNLDKNFIAGDALIQSENLGLGGKQKHWRKPALLSGKPIIVTWPKADVIIGNPPFNGTKKLKPDLGPDYVNAIRKAYPDVPGMADYCVTWIRKAHDHLPECTAADPVAGRAGLVGTQNIRNNQSRVGGLDHVVKSGTIIEAVDNQPWSGEANVHVAVANWVKTQNPKLLPKTRKLWFKVEPTAGLKKERKRGLGPTSKQYELDVRSCESINSALSDRANVALALPLTSNSKPKKVYQGITPGHDGFVLTEGEKRELERDGVSGQVIHPYLIGRELVTGDGTPERFVIDFGQRTVIEAQAFPAAFDRIRRMVLPDRIAKAEAGKDAEGKLRTHHRGFLDRWWALGWGRAEMFEGFKTLNDRFIACSRVTKRPIFVVLSTEIWPSDVVECFLLDDDYSFGILQSSTHWQWFVAKCSKFKSDFRYTTDTVFDMFPWPQTPSAKQIEAVAEAARLVRAVRAEALPKVKGGLRALYRTLEFPGDNPLKDAHRILDKAVLDAYGFGARGDLLAQVLALNLQVAEQIKKGAAVIAPGIPKAYPRPKTLVSNDYTRG